MTLLPCVLTGLTLLLIALTLHVTWRGRPSPDCTSSVVIVWGSHGEPVECVRGRDDLHLRPGLLARRPAARSRSRGRGARGDYRPLVDIESAPMIVRR